MSQATYQIARKEYECCKCGKSILKGQEYVKRNEGYRVHGITRYDAPMRWHRECPKNEEL